MNNKTAISLHNVSKSFSRELSLRNLCKIISKKNSGNDLILSNISIEINKGDFVALVGKNGAGKSTLLKLISGVLKPDSGTIQINGQINAIHELTSGFNQELNGYENLSLLATLKGISKKEFTTKLKRVISFSELTEKDLNKPIKYYSSGMKTRLAYSFNITFVKDILLLDEVFAVGDVTFVEKCINELRKLKKKGITIIIITHRINLVDEFITKSYKIENKSIEEQNIKSIDKSKRVIRVFKKNTLKISYIKVYSKKKIFLKISEKEHEQNVLPTITLKGKSKLNFEVDLINLQKTLKFFFYTSILAENKPSLHFTTKKHEIKKQQTISFSIDIPELMNGNYKLRVIIIKEEDFSKIGRILLDLSSFLPLGYKRGNDYKGEKRITS